MRAQEIADRFKISLRTVYRDVKTLEEAGIPVLGETGIGYSIMEGYRLPPVMFTREEAIAFLTAEKLVEKLTDASTKSSYQSAMFKVRSVLRSTEKDMLENIDEHIEVIQQYGPFNTDSVNNTLQLILKSISEKKVLHIHYTAFDAKERTERDIEPVGIFYSGGRWHTVAFCRLRDGYRDFRTDRIKQIRETAHTFEKNHPTLKTYLDQLARQENLEKVVVNIKKQAAKYLQEQKRYYGFVSEEEMDDNIQMTFLTPSFDMFIRWFLMYADVGEIIYPKSLTAMLKEHIEKFYLKL